MKNRILSILLTIILSFSLVACSQSSDEKTDKDDKQKTESSDRDDKDDKDERETTITDKTEMTMEEKLLSGYWYMNMFELGGIFAKIQFMDDGTIEVEMLSKYSSGEKSNGEWQYDDKNKTLSWFFEGSNTPIEMFYNEEKECFQYDYQNFLFEKDEHYYDDENTNLYYDDIPDEYKKFYDDGMNIHLFPYEKSFESLDAEAFNNLLTVVYGYDDYSDIYNGMVDNVEATRIQKDKSAIGELHHAIELSMAYIDGEVKVNPNPVKVNSNGEISIAELFDTSTSAGRSFVAELEYTLGDNIALSSRMKNDCTIQIVKFNSYSGIVVIQVISEEADLEFYIDSTGENEGIYIVEEEPDEPDFSQRPELDYYGSGEIKIWVSQNMVDITEQYAEAFLLAYPEYKGYSVVVEPVGEGDAASNMINNLEYGADIYGFAQDQLPELALNGALYDVSNTYYSDYIIQNNDACAVKAAKYDDGIYGFPITSDNGYFMYYDKSVITDPTSLETIISDCERAGKKIYFQISNGWYQTAFFFGTGCELNYDVNSSGTISNCNIDYDSEAGLVALKEIIDLTSSPAFKDATGIYNLTTDDNAAVVISGTWDRQSAMDLFGDNYAAAKLPEFIGCDGKEYQLSGFCGNKLLGVKPQTDQGKAIVCLNLAEYLSSADVQEARYDYMGWIPSNLEAQQNYFLQTDAAACALLDQNQYAQPQGQYPYEYWDRATTLANEIIAGFYINSSDSELRNVLAQFELDCESYAGY